MAQNLVHDYRRQDFPHSKEMYETFENIFGLQEFRDNQLEAVNATILKNNVFVVGGNGAGKSLCYQLPAYLSAGVTVVISPLKALIQDQIQKLTDLGIEAWTPLGDQGYTDAESIYQKLLKIKLLYVTPEELSESVPLMEALQHLLDQNLLARLAIDEAQCISQPDIEYFRTAYGKLNNMLRENFPKVPMIAVAGPIRNCTQQDILMKLQMTKPQVFTMYGTNQTNLKYAVLTKTLGYWENNCINWGKDCIEWIKEHRPHDSGIVYCFRTAECDSMAKSLNEAGLVAYSYHSGIPDKERKIRQNKWNENECQVICATIAFGMGIHKPDVRYVIHTFLPKSMENYHRESGRAGLDGMMSHCILYYSNPDGNDLCKIIRFGEFKDDEPENRELVNIGPMEEYCRNKTDCRRKQLLTYICGVDPEAHICLPGSEAIAICDNCERANAGAAAPN